MGVLTSKQYRTSDTMSRYSAFPIYYNKLDDKWVGGTTSYLKNTTTYSKHRVVSGDTWDTLAFKYYHNPSLYWVLCSFNRVQDPFTNPTVGTSIKIPTLSSIEFDV